MKNFIQGHFKLANLKCVKYTDKHKMMNEKTGD